MPYCMNCGQKLPDGAKYCTSCGAEQSLALETEEKNNSFSEITTEIYGQQDMVENPEREETSSARFEQNEQQNNQPKIPLQNAYAPQQASFQPQQGERKHPNLLWAIGAFVAAIVGLFVSGWVGLIISAAVLVLSIIVIAKKGRLYGFAITALVISCLGIFVSTYNVVLTTNVKKFTEITAETKEEVRGDEEHPDFLVGTYVGEHGCGLTLFPDGATRYYFYTNPDILTEGTWKYADGEFVWHFKGGNALSNCDVTAEIEGEDASELYLQSPSLVWDDEYYKKVSDKTEDYSEADYQAMIRDVYPDVLGAKGDTSGYKEVEYIGITFQFPKEFNSSKSNDNGVDYYMNDNGSSALLFCGVKGLGLPQNPSKDVLEEAYNLILDNFIENAPQELSLEGEDEYSVDGMVCKERDYHYKDSGKTATLRLAMMINEESDSALVSGVLIEDTQNEKDGLDVFEKMMKTAKRVTGVGTGTTTRQNGSSDSGSADGVDPDLKAYLDSYEAFMDEYVDFMKSYLNDPTNVVAMLDEYTDITKRMEEFEKQNDAYESSDMSAADLEYFLDVTTRCTKKMLEVYSN